MKGSDPLRATLTLPNETQTPVFAAFSASCDVKETMRDIPIVTKQYFASDPG